MDSSALARVTSRSPLREERHPNAVTAPPLNRGSMAPRPWRGFWNSMGTALLSTASDLLPPYGQRSAAAAEPLAAWQRAANRRRAVFVLLTVLTTGLAASLFASAQPEHDNAWLQYGQLALFGAGPWDAVPTIPPELMLAPRWFPVHISKISYWARTVVVPLLVLCALKPRARNLKQVFVHELFSGKPAKLSSQADHVHQGWKSFFNGLDFLLTKGDRLWPKALRRNFVPAPDFAKAFHEAHAEWKQGVPPEADAPPMKQAAITSSSKPRPAFKNNVLFTTAGINIVTAQNAARALHFSCQRNQHFAVSSCGYDVRTKCSSSVF